MKTQKFSLSDVPLEQNLNDFGTEGYVKGLERFIIHAATPITIALQGEWGSGKTSLMNRLYNDLCEGECEFIGININTWEYSMLASPEETVIKILGELVNSLTEYDSKANSKGKQYIKSVLNFAYRLGREFTKGIVPGAGLIVEGLGITNELPISQEAETASITLAELKKTLSESINKALLENNKKGILIFVDDLDRLNPPLAVQILELLKNIFTLNNCIFILAIDYDVVVKGLEPKFGKFSDTNEREFRSFFDKIIQVPFSLPVNNYKPMNFVLDSLVTIGYISQAQKGIPYIQDNIEKIVVTSVGKNPRSIKRLINTLSLLDCIGKCADKESMDDNLETKIINFAIVALQVCYPKIYNILSQNPDFSKWDETIANKLNLHFNDEDKVINGEVIIDALCEKDIYLNKHHDDIIKLIEIINLNAEEIDKHNPTSVIKNILDRSSYTNVNTPMEVEALDGKAFMFKLHNNVWDYISRKQPNLRKPQFKKNTGNGGYFVFLPDGMKRGANQYFEVIFQPTQTERIYKGKKENIIALKIKLDVWNARPERLKDVPYEEVINDSKVREVIEPLAEPVKKLSQYGIIEGRTFHNGKIYQDLYEEYNFRKDELWGSISGNTEYWINQKLAENFEDPSIVAAIGDLILGAYEMNVKANSLD